MFLFQADIVAKLTFKQPDEQREHYDGHAAGGAA
jgi:hypothetical protein